MLHQHLRIRHRERLDAASASLASSLSAPLPSSSAYTRRRGRNAVAGPSAIHVTRESMGLPSKKEEGILERMQVAEGISAAEMLHLFEQCDLCAQYFLSSFLKNHILSGTCTSDSK